jgi:hypothetical protein
MWTRDGSRRGDDSEDPRIEICKNCSTEFERRRASNKFCPECGEDRRCRDQHARQVLRRILTRKEFLEILTPQLIAHEREGRRFARWAQRDEIDGRLAEAEHLLITEGPNNRKVRSNLKKKAALIHETLDPREQDLLARTKELLCDVGPEAEEDQRSARRYAAEAVVLYRTIPRTDRDDRYHARIAGALLRFSNACQSVGDLRTAKDATIDAYYILAEKCDARDPIVLRLRHQADARTVRFLGERGWKNLQRHLDEMIALAAEINTPDVQLETACQLAGYWRMCEKPDRGLAMEQLEVIAKVLEKMPGRSAYDAPTFLRPRIEWFLASDIQKEKEEGIRLIVEEYAACYRLNSLSYFWDVMEQWCRRPSCRKLGLREELKKLALPHPTYNSSMRMALPRGY